MKFVSALFYAAALFAFPQVLNAQIMVGKALVIDGDTLEFSGTRLRLIGIDAPESDQTCDRSGSAWQCGKAATDYLKTLVNGRKIECRAEGKDRYGRLLAFCVSESLDLGLSMVGAGLAVATKGGPEEYQSAEAIRKAHKIGLWASVFQTPSDWRADHPIQAAQATTPKHRNVRANRVQAAEKVYRNQFGCAIKGNRNRRGQWIYHLPGRPYYDQTRPEELFCTETQARNAGYRRSKA